MGGWCGHCVNHCTSEEASRLVGAVVGGFSSWGDLVLNVPRPRLCRANSPVVSDVEARHLVDVKHGSRCAPEASEVAYSQQSAGIASRLTYTSPCQQRRARGGLSAHQGNGQLRPTPSTSAREVASRYNCD
jgi:hypothetical protein